MVTGLEEHGETGEMECEEENPPDEDPDESDEKYIDIDRGVISATRQKTEQRKCDEYQYIRKVFYPMQECLADMIVGRIEDILWIYHGRKLTDFKDFDFQIYTARYNMLEKQTLFRVMDPMAMCFPSLVYEDKEALSERADERVQKYLFGKTEEKRFEDLQKRAKKEKDTLFLIVADEAHWGFGKSDAAEGSKAGANNKLVNSWTNDFPNVIVLLVTATGFNLKTKDSRLNHEQLVGCVDLPGTSSDANAGGGNRDCLHLVTRKTRGADQYLYTRTGENVKSHMDKVYPLHNIRWTEGHNDTFIGGMVVKLRIPNKVASSTKWLAIGKEQSDVGLLPLMITEDHSEAIELKFQGNSHNTVTISYTDEDFTEYQLISVKDWAAGNPVVGFAQTSDLAKFKLKEFKPIFTIHMNFGEDVLLIQVNDQDVKSYSYLKMDAKHIVLAKEPSNVNTISNCDLPVHPLEFSFLVDYTRSIDELKPGRQYLSLNFYYNTMRNAEPDEQLLRGDPALAQTLKKLCKKEKKAVATVDDYLAADYAYYILLVEELRKCQLTSKSFTEMLHKPEHALGRYTETKEKLFNGFKLKLHNAHDDKGDKKPITAEVFTELVNHVSEVKRQALLKFCKAMNRTDFDTADEFFDHLIDYLLHMTVYRPDTPFTDSMKDIREQIGDKIGVLENHFKDIAMNFDETKTACLNKSETFKIINKVIQDVPVSGIDGKMVVVRVSSSERTQEKEDPNTTSPGNRFYSTLCYARLVARTEESFKFEVIRDFQNFKISDIMSESVDTSKYRIHSRLQPKKCEYVDSLNQGCTAGPRDEACNNYVADQPPLRCRNCGHIHRNNDNEKQPKACEFSHNQRVCSCSSYDPVTPSLRCLECGHIHKEIKDYKDCNRLPCILIMVKKGRLGDTFPDSFFAMDLRVSSESKPYLSTLMQELGRLCRYDNKPIGPNQNASYAHLPYALINHALVKTLKPDALNQYAVLYGSFVKSSDLDHQIKKERRRQPKHSKTIGQDCSEMSVPVDEDEEQMITQYEAAKWNADHGNLEKHNNRLLLEAEPQIGKTGVYLKTISILRKTVCGFDPPNQQAEQSDEDPISEAEDADTTECEASALEEDAELWKYPYWKEMQSSKYPSKFACGKYGATAGSKHMDTNSPSKMDPSLKKIKSKKVHTNEFRPDGYKAYSYSDPQHLSCKMCRSESPTIVTEVNLPGMNVKMSIPLARSYLPLLEQLADEYTDGEHTTAHDLIKQLDTLSQSMTQGGSYRDKETPESRTLKCWIFTPSYRRPSDATLNYRHTMVEQDSPSKCYYMHFIVVRQEEFKSYQAIWGSTHVVVQLPHAMPDCEKDVTSGIGYARLFVQIFARHFGEKYIFMLDDNIKCVSEVVSEVKGDKHLLVRKDGSLKMTEIPLFKVLKHLESQFLRTDPPNITVPYENCPDTPAGELEEYTGSYLQYAALGILKDRKGIDRVKQPFKKTNVYSLVLLNLVALEMKDIEYKPTSHREDIELCQNCNEAGLWPCKYNRFKLRKVGLKSHITHDMFWWTNDARIPAPKTKGLNVTQTRQVEVFYRWIHREYPPSRTALHGRKGTSYKDKVNKELQEYFSRFNKIKNGSSHLLLFGSYKLDELKQYFCSTSGIGGFTQHIILLSVKFCHEHCLLQRSDFKKKVVDPIFNTVAEDSYDVITSHNIDKFKVFYVVLLVNGKISAPMDDLAESNAVIPEVIHRRFMFKKRNITPVNNQDAATTLRVETFPRQTEVSEIEEEEQQHDEQNMAAMAEEPEAAFSGEEADTSEKGQLERQEQSSSKRTKVDLEFMQSVNVDTAEHAPNQFVDDYIDHWGSITDEELPRQVEKIEAELGLSSERISPERMLERPYNDDSANVEGSGTPNQILEISVEAGPSHSGAGESSLNSTLEDISKDVADESEAKAVAEATSSQHADDNQHSTMRSITDEELPFLVAEIEAELGISGEALSPNRMLKRPYTDDSADLEGSGPSNKKRDMSIDPGPSHSGAGASSLNSKYLLDDISNDGSHESESLLTTSFKPVLSLSMPAAEDIGPQHVGDNQHSNHELSFTLMEDVDRDTIFGVDTGSDSESLLDTDVTLMLSSELKSELTEENSSILPVIEANHGIDSDTESESLLQTGNTAAHKMDGSDNGRNIDNQLSTSDNSPNVHQLYSSPGQHSDTHANDISNDSDTDHSFSLLTRPKTSTNGKENKDILSNNNNLIASTSQQFSGTMNRSPMHSSVIKEDEPLRVTTTQAFIDLTASPPIQQKQTPHSFIMPNIRNQRGSHNHYASGDNNGLVPVDSRQSSWLRDQSSGHGEGDQCFRGSPQAIKDVTTSPNREDRKPHPFVMPNILGQTSYTYCPVSGETISNTGTSSGSSLKTFDLEQSQKKENGEPSLLTPRLKLSDFEVYNSRSKKTKPLEPNMRLKKTDSVQPKSDRQLWFDKKDLYLLKKWHNIKDPDDT